MRELILILIMSHLDTTRDSNDMEYS